ncbi:MAG: TPM domain-containing protein [Lachnospiraceae bacterium]|nr:TPM domain-containing protein [Lachnospiraceae bacterium]
MVKKTEKMRRIYAAIVLTLMLVFTGTLYCAAEEAPAVVVNDKAALLMEEERDWLKEEAQEVADRSGFNMIISTCDDAAGESTQYICEDLFNTYTIGDDGVSCLIDMDNREIYLATAGDAQLYLTDDKIDDILDEAYEAVADENYSECLYIMIYRIGEYYDAGITEDVYVYNEDTGETYIYDAETGEYVKEPPLCAFDVFVACIAALIVGILVYVIIVGKYKLKWGTYRYDFHDSGKLTLTKEKDQFVNKVVTRRHIPKNTGSSSGGNRSTVHNGAGGRSFGGGGRKF